MSLSDADDGVAPLAPPIVVHCLDGATYSGLFCASWIICEKMRLEKQVDFFHAVKALKTKRHGIISSLVGLISSLEIF
jgi:Protein-tyrosine phosphatase